MAERRYWLFVALALLLGSWLRAPALDATLIGDDWDHYAMAEGVYPAARAPWDLYTFIADDEAERQALRASGRLPWWSDSSLQISFLRPLASLTVWSDHALFGGAFRLALLGSLAWWLAGALAIAAVLRRALPAAAALLAVALYSVDDAHALPLAWVASRSELMAIALMGWALWAQLRYQRQGRARDLWLSVALVALAMTSGEHALSMLAFPIACALAERDKPLWHRRNELLLLVAPALAYVAVRAALGYGAAGSRFYVDPFTEPMRFLRALGDHVPLLSGDLALGYAADYQYGEPPWRKPLLELGVLPSAWLAAGSLHVFQWWVGLASVIGSVAACIALGRRPGPARAVCWMLAGALVSLVPLAAAPPMTRLTAGPSLGFHAAFAWIALEALRVLRTAPTIRRRLGAFVLCAAPIAVHGAHAGVRGRELTAYYAVASHTEADWIASARLGSSDVSRRRVFLLGSSDVSASFALPYIRRRAGRTVPATSDLLLPPHSGPLLLERISPSILDVSSRSKDGFTTFRVSAYRHGSRAFTVGDYWPGPRFSVVVIGVREGLPTRLRFVFPRPLEDASQLFVYPMADGLKPLALPAVGRSARLPAPAWPRRL